MTKIASLLALLAAPLLAHADGPSASDFGPVGVPREAFASFASVKRLEARVDDLSDRLVELSKSLTKLEATCGSVASAQKCDIEGCKCGCREGKACRCAANARTTLEEAWKADGWVKEADGFWYKYPVAPAAAQAPVQYAPRTMQAAPSRGFFGGRSGGC